MHEGALHQRIAIVTGASGGIGREVARAFARAGCTVALVARNEKELQATANMIREETQQEAAVFPLDIVQEASVKEMTSEVVSRFKKINILVNAAATVGPIGPFEKNDAAAWEETLHINLMGTIFTARAVLPFMTEKRYGSIINFAGGGAFAARPRFSAYSVSKAAVVRLTDALAQEFKDSGITVNAISPGQVNTRMFEEMFAAGEEKVGKKAWDEFVERKKSGGDSIEEVGRLAVFLASDQARKITGRTISARWDPWEHLPEHADELAASDIYTMRRIKPEDHGKHW